MADFLAIAFILSVIACIVGGVSSTCPKGCVCNEDETLVNCSSSHLTSIPFEIPSSVLTLDLSHNNIERIGIELGYLPHLRSLDLSYNVVDDIAPKAFTGLENLLEISVEHNSISSRQLDTFSNLTSLQTWKMSHNNITHVPKVVLSNLRSLTLLDVSWNNMNSDSVKRFLNNLPVMLHTLYLDGNNLYQVSLDVSLDLPSLSDDEEMTNSSDQVTTQSVVTTTSFPVGPSQLTVLSLTYCNLNSISNNVFQRFHSLEMLDLSNNNLQDLDDLQLCNLNLTYLNLGNNTFEDIPNDFFMDCSSLVHLKVTDMSNMTHINSKSFQGLQNVEIIDLSFNPQLWFVQTEAFQNLPMLQTLDLRNCAIRSLNKNIFYNVTMEKLALHDNPWSCDCETRWIYSWLQDMPPGTLMHNVYCASPIQYEGKSIEILPAQDFNCSGAYISNFTEVAWSKVGRAAVLDCVAYGDPLSHITWITPRKFKLTYHPAYVDFGDAEPHDDGYHTGHYWHSKKHYHRPSQHGEHMYVLQNGSLYIDFVTRSDGGNYTCIASNSHGNETVIVQFNLDYYIITMTKLWSMVVGFGCAIGFLTFGIVLGAIRALVKKCSPAEKRKRNGIREILQNLHEYKAAQFGKIKEYKTAKVEKVAAYKAAKIGKIRDYKQATVASILQHMHNMQEHYNSQVGKIKDNCSQQADKLRENYQCHISKLKDYRSEKVEKVRDHYKDQALKIRDYGSTHMEKLREQYKSQQQHLLKLLELLDIGNCMSVIEAECMRTDSMLFNPDINFDLEAQPVHVPKDCFSTEDDDSSEYMTAGSQSERSSISGSGFCLHSNRQTHRRSNSNDSNQSNSLPCQANMETEIDTRKSNVKTDTKKSDSIPRSINEATFPLVVDDNEEVMYSPPPNLSPSLHSPNVSTCVNNEQEHSNRMETGEMVNGTTSVCSDISSSDSMNIGDPSVRETIV